MRAPRPLFLLTGGAALLGLAALALPPGPRVGAWAVLTAVTTLIWVRATTVLRSRLLGFAWTEAPAPTRAVALTFDDGPDPAATPPLLDLLRERGAAATFFLVGERARAHPDLVRRIVAEGHAVGNHSDRHSPLTNFWLSGRLRQDLTACQETLTELTGAAPVYFRPPVGLANHATHPVAEALGLAVVGWRVRGLDTRGRAPASVVASILRRVRGGDVVLLHDGGRAPESVRAIVSGVLDGLAERDLEPVRLDRLLAGAGSGGDAGASHQAS